MKQLSRSLNQDAIIAGLNATDFSAIGVSIFVGLKLGEFLKLNHSGLALVVPLFFVSVLIPVRLRFRRKTIRDWLRYYLSSRYWRV